MDGKTKTSGSTSKDLLMVSLVRFYNNKTLVQKIVPIIEGKSEISLRLIDWFVTNYAKKHGTIITKRQLHNVIHFNVYLSYRSQLKAYSKQQFDPFRRRDRIMFYYDKDLYIETTIGQLNFFRWVLQNSILEYIVEYTAAIEKDMMLSQKENQSLRLKSENIRLKVIKKENGETVVQKRKKRNELSKSISSNLNHLHGKQTISFD
jgi:hypothetical protein